jgi:hypothetical protein
LLFSRPRICYCRCSSYTHASYDPYKEAYGNEDKETSDDEDK